MSNLAAATGSRPPTPMNRLGLDYRAEAERLGKPPVPIIDAHTHINGRRAAAIYHEAREAYGVVHTWSQTQLSQADDVGAVLGSTVNFVAVPNYMDEDRGRAHREGFLEAIGEWHRRGARMVKFWCAPRGRDYGREVGDDRLLTLESDWRRKQMDLAASLGMMFMAHIADPDTWFATKYKDSSRYGTKAEQYEPLERALEEYRVPWLIAHMAGWPEDLDFLTRFLDRHPNVVIDTSATKWMVRELSKHPTDRFRAFVDRFRGRILFGSDIVTMDAHLAVDEGPRGMGAGASSPEEAFDLYASRYWALRTLFETSYEGESPIADPDLQMVDPERYDAMSAPPLRGHALSVSVLKTLYNTAAEETLHAWHRAHP